MPTPPVPPAQPIGPVVQRRLVVWDAAGNPVVATTPYIPKVGIQQLALAALSLPYTTPEDELAIELGLPPGEYYGRPLAEVMLVKQALAAARGGRREDIDAALDRGIGKPKTSSENLNLNGSYEDFLKAAAQLMNAPAAPTPVDAEIVPPKGVEGLW